MILIQHFEADFRWKVSLKILNSGLILKTLTLGNELVVVSSLLAHCSSLYVFRFRVQSWFYVVEIDALIIK